MQGSEFETIYCMVDLHAITVWQDPADLRRNTRELCAGFIASGIDPEQSVLFNQSQVPEHTQLGWIFNTVARMDHATHVPVGEDQKQHVELTRDIAAKFNHDYGVDFFPITEPVIEGAATRVMSLRDGSKKMSKSDPSDMSRINMTDDADAIAQKIRKARTDPDALPSEVEGLKDRPEARNLLNIFAAMNDSSVEAVLADVGGKQFSEFKPMLADLAVAKLSPISTEMARLMEHPDEIDKILARGAERARALASPILKETYEIVGMVGS